MEHTHTLVDWKTDELFEEVNWTTRNNFFEVSKWLVKNKYRKKLVDLCNSLPPINLESFDF